jgi:Tol biopolymer transport system component
MRLRNHGSVRRRLVTGACLLAVCGAAIGTASAAYPGSNGKVAFDDGSVSPSRIGTVNPDGSGEATLSQRGDHWPRYSPDGSKIVFFSTRTADGLDNGSAEIYTMNADGSHQRQLTFNSVEDQTPEWTPEGRIVFGRRTGPGAWDIWVMNANGSNQRQVTDLAGASIWPSPSPNGGRIAFASDYTGQWHIYTSRYDGTGLKQITPAVPDGTSDWAPEWSPSGNEIAFTRETPAPGTDAGVDEDVWMVRTDGSQLRQLTSDPARADLFPNWSPDGRYVVFYGATDWEGPNWHSVLGTYNVKTGATGTVGRPDIGGAPGWQPLGDANSQS